MCTRDFLVRHTSFLHVPMPCQHTPVAHRHHQTSVRLIALKGTSQPFSEILYSLDSSARSSPLLKHHRKMGCACDWPVSSVWEGSRVPLGCMLFKTPGSGCRRKSHESRKPLKRSIPQGTVKPDSLLPITLLRPAAQAL